MKCLIFADLHTYKPYKVQPILEKVSQEKIDVIFILGDISESYFYDINDYFKEKEVPILIVLGNHDNRYVLDRWDYLQDIHNKIYRLDKLNILGIEGCLYMNGDKPNYISHTQENIINIFDNLNEKINIIISHNSPYGIHHLTYGDVHEGFKGLNNYMDKYKNTIIFHGHQHKNIISEYNNNKIIGIYGIVILDIIGNNIINQKILFEG